MKVIGKISWENNTIWREEKKFDLQTQKVSKENFWQKLQLPVDWQIDICKYQAKKKQIKKELEVAGST